MLSHTFSGVHMFARLYNAEAVQVAQITVTRSTVSKRIRAWARGHVVKISYATVHSSVYDARVGFKVLGVAHPAGRGWAVSVVAER